MTDETNHTDQPSERRVPDDDQPAALSKAEEEGKLPDVDRRYSPEVIAEVKALVPEITPHVAPVALSRWERFCRLLDL